MRQHTNLTPHRARFSVSLSLYHYQQRSLVAHTHTQPLEREIDALLAFGSHGFPCTRCVALGMAGLLVAPGTLQGPGDPSWWEINLNRDPYIIHLTIAL